MWRAATTWISSLALNWRATSPASAGIADVPSDRSGSIAGDLAFEDCAASGMTDRPSSTRTHAFLFADLREYTTFVERRGDRAATDLLRAYRSLVRSTLAEFDGAEIKTEGDSFYVVFASVGSAVSCAVAIQERAADATTSDPEHPITVGIGIHAGETAETTEGYVGSAVNIAARVCALAKAGDVLVTDTVRALTRAVLDVAYEPLGTRQLKGVAEPVAVFRAVPVGAGMPPTRSASRLRRWRRPTRRSLGSIGAVFAVAAVLVAVALLGGRALNPTSSASPSPTTASPASTPAPTSSGGLTAAQADLLDRIPSSIRATCRPSPANEVTARTIASLACSPSAATAEADRIWYEAFDPASQSPMSLAFSSLVTEHAIPHGDCARSATAYGEWSLPGAYAGQRLCYKDRDGPAWVVWTYDVLRILVRAERLDGQSTPLFNWSRTMAELLG
jgi:class 3 adenylate cyclase